jgi:hypothetical protein
MKLTKNMNFQFPWVLLSSDQLRFGDGANVFFCFDPDNDNDNDNTTNCMQQNPY